MKNDSLGLYLLQVSERLQDANWSIHETVNAPPLYPLPSPPLPPTLKKELNLNNAQLSRKIALVKTRKVLSVVEFVVTIILSDWL